MKYMLKVRSADWVRTQCCVAQHTRAHMWLAVPALRDDPDKLVAFVLFIRFLVAMDGAQEYLQSGGMPAEAGQLFFMYAIVRLLGLLACFCV